MEPYLLFFSKKEHFLQKWNTYQFLFLEQYKLKDYDKWLKNKVRILDL